MPRRIANKDDFYMCNYCKIKPDVWGEIVNHEVRWHNVEPAPRVGRYHAAQDDNDEVRYYDPDGFRIDTPEDGGTNFTETWGRQRRFEGMLPFLTHDELRRVRERIQQETRPRDRLATLEQVLGGNLGAGVGRQRPRQYTIRIAPYDNMDMVGVTVCNLDTRYTTITPLRGNYVRETHVETVARYCIDRHQIRELRDIGVTLTHNYNLIL